MTMSDFSQDQDRYIPEPDENVLIAALRNQDDIPILMDIVGEQLPARKNQEAHFSQSMQNANKITDDATVDEASSDIGTSVAPTLLIEETPTAEAHTEETKDVSLSLTSSELEAALAVVLKRMLPTIASEVVEELQKKALVSAQS